MHLKTCRSQVHDAPTNRKFTSAICFEETALKSEFWVGLVQEVIQKLTLILRGESYLDLPRLH